MSVPFLVTRIVYGYLALLALLYVQTYVHLSLLKRLHRVFGICGLSNLIPGFCSVFGKKYAPPWGRDQ